ncbi:MAG: hypothetical protein O2796_07940 [Bacteroidetes bacterium]|nr:hypothetical protein [Bacteroidota bacterium]MDA0880308.1 hypothetical protein [Bacteroidota bacterium]MDA1115379.1 hypothetical protein [Bacteroidota bacterium]
MVQPGIFNAHFLVTRKDPCKGYPFQSFNGSEFTGGFSDHSPACVYLIKEQRYDNQASQGMRERSNTSPKP